MRRKGRQWCKGAVAGQPREGNGMRRGKDEATMGNDARVRSLARRVNARCNLSKRRLATRARLWFTGERG
eukprot:9482228-Pyramimonas_sp.AAC.1